MPNRQGVWSLSAVYQALGDQNWLMAPAAPTGISATAGDSEADVSFTAPTFTGIPSGITGYKATSNPSGITATGSSSPITVTGLTNGTAYTFTVQATNSIDYGPESSASGSVTPTFTERAFFLGGTIGVAPDKSNEIDHFTITTTGNATDWGDLTSITDFGTGCGSSTRGIYFFGRDSAGNKVNNIDYFDATSTGNSSDFGDNTSAKYSFAAASNSTRGLAAGGDGQINDIRYITIASTGNATDFGDMTIARSDFNGGVASSTRACFGGGFNSGTPSLYNLNIIDYVTIGTTGNAIDFGDLTTGRNGCGSSSSSTRGLFFGGNNTNIIDYITIASTGNAIDFGDLSSTSWSGGASAAGTTRALYGGTSNNAGNVAYVTIASTGNASDFGDLQLTGGTSIKRSLGACSNAHGGLS
jgi:hypothetical protein